MSKSTTQIDEVAMLFFKGQTTYNVDHQGLADLIREVLRRFRNRMFKEISLQEGIQLVGLLTDCERVDLFAQFCCVCGTPVVPCRMHGINE